MNECPVRRDHVLKGKYIKYIVFQPPFFMGDVNFQGSNHHERSRRQYFHTKSSRRSDAFTPLKTNMTLENHHVQ